MATKGIPVFNFLPKIRLAVKSGDAFSLKAFKALLGKIAYLQEAGQGDAVLTEQVCRVNDPFQTVKFTITYGDGQATYASGTATLDTVIADDAIDINGLTYTFKAAPAATGEVLLSAGDDVANAAALAEAINDDTRIGTLGKCSATSADEVVTVTTNVAGTAGNAVEFTTTDATITLDPATDVLAGGLATVTTDNNIFANGTIEFSTVVATNSVTIDGKLYSGVTGTKADNTEFSVDTSDAAALADLALSINNDDREGASGGSLTAVVQGSVLYVTTDVPGTAGNAVTFVKTGTPITISGSGTLTGGQSQIDVYADNTEDTTPASGSDLATESLSGGRALDIAITGNGYPFNMRSAMAAARKIEEFENHHTSRGFATGTVTLASVQASDTVTINGVEYKAVANAAAEVAAGDFRIDQTDTLDAARLVAVINADTRDDVTFKASNAAGVVTITSKIPGEAGNVTLASSNGTRLAVSGAKLTGGGGDGTYTDVLCRGHLPTETYLWDITKLGKVYTLAPTAGS